MESIKHVRKLLGLSLTEVARRTGLHDEQVARAERAGVDPRASTLVTLAKALGVPVCKLFGKERQHERRAGRKRRRK